MEIVRMQILGFCKGVERAARLTERILEKAKGLDLPVYALGSLVHNTVFNSYMEKKGLRIIDGSGDLAPGFLILRTHGVSDRLKREYLGRGMILCDSTCPVVLHEQSLVRHAAPGEFVLIVGTKNHPEVMALYGVADRDNDKMIISSLSDLDRVPKDVALLVVMQSTASPSLANPILAELERWKQKGRPVRIGNKQCHSTESRLHAIQELAGKVDCVLVVGDRQSANTNGLVEKVTNAGKCARLVSDASDLDEHLFDMERLGIASGASTPMFVIDEIIAALKGGVEKWRGKYLSQQ